mgnify:CR=1
MSEYTPAPWEIQECIDGSYDLVHKNNEETRLICRIEPACNIKNDLPLIENAPELIEKLETILEYSEEGLLIDGELADEIVELIRKAKGEDE